MAAFNLPYF